MSSLRSIYFLGMVSALLVFPLRGFSDNNSDFFDWTEKGIHGVFPSVRGNFQKFYKDFKFLKLDTFLFFKMKAETLTYVKAHKKHGRDYSAEVLNNPEIKNLVMDLDEILGSNEELSVFEKDAYNFLIQDLLAFTSVHFDHWKKKGPPGFYEIYTISPLTPAHLTNVLKGLKGILLKKKNRYSGALDHIEPLKYKKYKVFRRAFLLTFLKIVDASITKDIAEDPLYYNLIRARSLPLWLLASTGSASQKYLNTCAATVFYQKSMIGHSILTQIKYGEALRDRLIQDFESLPPAMKGERAYKAIVGSPSREKYFKSRIKKFNFAINNIYEDALDLSFKNVTLSENLDEVKELTLRWQKAMETLASIINVKNMKYNSKRLYSEHFVTSAVVASVPALMGSLLPGKPTPMERFQGDIDTNSLRYLSKDIVKTYWSNMDYIIEKIVGEEDVSKNSTNLLELWRKAFYLGGIEIGIPGHAVFWKPIKVKGKKYFLLSDPKNSLYELFDFGMAAKWLQKYWEP